MAANAKLLPAKQRRLKEEMEKRGVDASIIDQVMENAPTSANRAVQSVWFRAAMARMDALLSEDTRHAVREGCACCTGGTRLAMAKNIAKTYATLDERLRALSAQTQIVGHDAQWLPDGKIRVRYAVDAENAYCPCLTVDPEKPMPMTYCYCCLGHIRVLLETALGVKAQGEPVSTLLSSCGKLPCVFDLAVVETV